ncbi:LysM peptidoglycan-binding domain-containing protein [uncultured Jannaschia sp.]|uniref:LysM peptidoglycan-binding domain-containing protein n=1 Tax=uncultured Jannaschia sp. TaxID=293347 RepID=UPI002610572F|nr:LysM peptidoglycan-binding domain-containing protein [uncultured Jannaschia sp.]
MASAMPDPPSVASIETLPRTNDEEEGVVSELALSARNEAEVAEAVVRRVEVANQPGSVTPPTRETHPIPQEGTSDGEHSARTVGEALPDLAVPEAPADLYAGTNTNGVPEVPLLPNDKEKGPLVAAKEEVPGLMSLITEVDKRPAIPSSLGSSQGSEARTTSATDVSRGPLPPRLLRTGPNGVSVVPATSPGPATRKELGIDAISYDASGEVQIAGHGLRDMQLRIYLDNRPVQVVQIDDHGAWAVELPELDRGVYTLRVDALAPDGSVASRVETPFQRTAPEVAAAARRDGLSAITVQPGYTLWAISEGYFGEGVRYVQIFAENRDRIRDPDLIFPGQIFTLP